MISEAAIAHEERLRDRRDNPPEPPPGTDTLAAARLVNEWFASWSSDPGVTTTKVSAAGVRALWVDHPDNDASTEATLLYLHGGGYMVGDADHVVKMIGHILANPLSGIER